MSSLRHEFVGYEDPVNGPETQEIWRKNGELHRDDGPALITRDASQKTVRQEWYREGQLHRDDGPAVLIQNEFVNAEEWYENGLLHRYWHPAKLSRSIHTGILTQEVYYLKGEEHRTDSGPSRTYRDNDTGVIEYQSWRRYGKLHRTDGPAEIERDPYTGEITMARFCLQDDEVQPTYHCNIPSP
ncbi:MAG: hypothetical protein AAGI03_03070 [Pseudomonadota bacterium]